MLAVPDATKAMEGEAFAIHHDVPSKAAWVRVLLQAEARFGGIDVFVNDVLSLERARICKRFGLWR